MIPNKEELLKNLLKKNENHCLEFKVNNSNPELLGKYISALSNMAVIDNVEYGYLVYGISDEKHEIVGTSLDLCKNKVGNIVLEFWLNSLLYPKGIFDFDSVLIDNKRIVIIRIKKAVSITTTFSGNEFGRVNESIVSLSEFPQLRKELWEKILFSARENDVALASIPSLELEKYIDIRKYYSLLKQAYPLTFDEISNRLIGEGFIKKRDDGRYDITILGALCIATSFSYYPSLGDKGIEIIKYSTSSRASSTSVPIKFDSGYLFCFEPIINTVINLMGAKEVVERGIRMKQEPIPALIIREMVGNALIHQDIGLNSGKVLIECFPSRLEIFNYGKLAVDIDRVVDMAPMPENRHLVEILSRFGIGEGHGTGFDKIVLSSETNVLPPPLVKKEQYGVRVIAYTYKPWSEYTLEEKKRAVYLHCCLAYIDGEKATNESIRKRFGLAVTNKAQVSRLIKQCIEDGKIKPSKESTGTRNLYYYPYWA